MKNLNFWRRLGFSINGIASAFKSEASLRFQLFASIGAFFVLLILRPPAIWWAMICLTIAAVLTAEMFNTALERVMDRLHPEHHLEIGLAKDCAAGAVLITSLASLGVFAALLWETLGPLFN